MRTVFFALQLTILALVLAATATGSPSEPAQSGSCAKANLNLVKDGHRVLGHDLMPELLAQAVENGVEAAGSSAPLPP